MTHTHVHVRSSIHHPSLALSIIHYPDKSSQAKTRETFYPDLDYLPRMLCFMLIG